MSRVGAAVDEALAELPLPGAEVLAVTAEGGLHHSAHGSVTKGAMYRLFSMTKLVGALIALKAVEEGALRWGDLVGAYLPDFGDLQVIDGFDGETPRLRAQATKATLMDLATHRSGAAYMQWCAPVAAYCRHEGIKGLDDSTRAGLRSLPLALDPGAGWAYGTGIDWLGLAVQEAMGERLEVLVEERLLKPLGIESLVFALDLEQEARLTEANIIKDGSKTTLANDPPHKPDHAPMGSALYGDAAGFARLLQMILRGGEDVLSPASIDSLFSPRTGPLPPMISQSPTASADVDLFPGYKATFALGGLRVEQDIPGKRRAGSVGWAGMLNTHFWIDRTAGVAGLAMMQHLPFVDANAMAVYDAFERALYKEL
ncbi:MAG: serine hydrolase domain-containing protein [Pseudomonadota bacterium]